MSVDSEIIEHDYFILPRNSYILFIPTDIIQTSLFTLRLKGEITEVRSGQVRSFMASVIRSEIWEYGKNFFLLKS